MIRPLRIFASVVCLVIAACGKKPSPAETSALQAESPAPVPKPLSPAERAEKLGFLAHLSADTEAVLSFPNSQSSLTRIKNSGWWKFIESRSTGDSTGEESGDGSHGGGDDIDGSFGNDGVGDGAFDEPPKADAASDHIELAIAFGKTTTGQTGALFELNQKLTMIQFIQYVRLLAEAETVGGLVKPFSGNDSMEQDAFRELLADENALALVESLRMPPLLVALRNDKDGNAQTAAGITSMISMIGMIGEAAEPLSVERAGSTFEGYRISGSAVAAMLEAQREAIDSMVGASPAARLVAAAASRDLVVLSGNFGGYLVVFIGGSADDLVLITDPAQSLAASDRLAFTDAYRDRELLTVFHGSQELLDTVTRTAGGLGGMAEGIRKGLASVDGDTAELQECLRGLAANEARLTSRIANEPVGIVAFHDNGWRIEVHGGGDQGMIDWQAPNRLGALGNAKNTAIFANFSIARGYQEEANAYLESLGSTISLMTGWIAGLPVDDPGFLRFRDGFRVFEGTFREDLGEAWSCVSTDLDASLGGERAYVVDFDGTAPILPDVPADMLRDLPFPRASIIAPVADRSKLAESWTRLDTVLQRMIGKSSELTGQPIPRIQPIDSERNGFTTWFLPFPVFTDGFMPSVSLNDSWFAASTSRGQALDLLASASDPSAAESRGLRVVIGMDALRDGLRKTSEVVRAHPEAFDTDAAQLDDVLAFLDATRELERIEVNGRREAGGLRTSIHLRTR